VITTSEVPFNTVNESKPRLSSSVLDSEYKHSNDHDRRINIDLLIIIIIIITTIFIVMSL